MVCRRALVVAFAPTLAIATASAEVSKLEISKQPGLLFAPMLLMEHHKLVEKHAKDAGVPDLKASWLTMVAWMPAGAGMTAERCDNLCAPSTAATRAH